jgi:hypothetical protein
LNLLLQFYLRLFVYQLIAYYSLYAATNCSAIAKISVASKSGVLDKVYKDCPSRAIKQVLNQHVMHLLNPNRALQSLAFPRVLQLVLFAHK